MLTRVLRGANYKTPSGELARRVALEFELPDDYFPEFREAFMLERIRADPKRRDELYSRLKRGRSSRARS